MESLPDGMQALNEGKKNKREKFYFYFYFFLLFICAYNVWVISHPFSLLPPFPLSLSLSLHPLATRKKLFCPYL
jgi:hypothetical protein